MEVRGSALKGKMPLVSVLIPCFNANCYVRDCIESVFYQTHRNVEIIVVDDGSKDNSAEVVAGLENRGVRLIQQKNSGAAAARNTAFRASSGEFILFLDADDVIGNRHIEALLYRCVGDNRTVSMSQWDRFYTEPSEASFPLRQSYRNSDGISWLVSEWANARAMTQSGMFLVPRELIEEIGLWNENCSYTDDFEFFARLITHCRGISFAPEARLYYRSGMTNSLSHQRNSDAVFGAFTGLLLGTEHLIKAENSARTRRVCANVLQNFIYEYYPNYPLLRKDARRIVDALGGSDLEPDGPPGFQNLRTIVGWRLARRVQRIAESLRRAESKA